MRLAFVTQDLSRGGAERHLVELVLTLQKLGWECRVYCLRPGGEYSHSLIAKGVTPEVLISPAKSHSLLAPLRLRRRLGKFSPNVIMTSGLKADFVTRIALAPRSQVLFVSWKHNCGYVGTQGIKERWLERWTGRSVSFYFGVAFAQVPFLTREIGIAPHKIRIFHNTISASSSAPPVTMSRAGLGMDPSLPVLGIVAGLRPYKGHSTALRALRKCHEEGAVAQLLLVGDGPLRSDLRELAKQLGILDYTHFLGDRDDVEEILPLMDVVLLPSETVECFPYAILEAMAAERPVVCSAVGGLAEMVDDGYTGYLVSPSSVDLLADRILTLLRAPDRAARLGAEGGVRVRTRFDRASWGLAIHETLLEALDARETRGADL